MTDDPPPMAEQLKWMVSENARLRAELVKAENRVRHWKEQEAKQRRLHHEKGEWKHRALAAELNAAHLDEANEGMGRKLAAVKALLLYPPAGASDAEILAAARFLLRAPAPEVPPATHEYAPMTRYGRDQSKDEVCGLILAEDDDHVAVCQLPADHPIHQATPEEPGDA